MKEYSIAIRTLGRAGEKYQKLLDSIAASQLQPKRVIVVLPEGFEPPKEQLGCEQFVYCAKSMIGQRMEALNYIDTEYTLFLDDDIAFGESFVEQLLEPLEEGLFDCATGPLFSFFPASKAGAIAGTLTSSVSVSVFRRDMYVKILRSAGWSYHTFDTSVKRFYPTDSFAWTCFMIRTDVMRKIGMASEKPWLERHSYAYGDDQTMAYKMVKNGFRSCIVSNALYDHNDAQTSTSAKEMVNTKRDFCNGYFHVVFWQRFIQDPEHSWFWRVCNRCCLTYWQMSMYAYHTIKSLKASHRPHFKAFREGIRDAKQYIRSDEYKELPSIMISSAQE